MGKNHRKNKKRKLSQDSGGSTDRREEKRSLSSNNDNEDDGSKKHNRESHNDKHNHNKEKKKDLNPLYTKQAKFLSSLQPIERTHFFSNLHVSPERRAELWMQQADLGEELVNSYAWAIPNETALKIFQHFSPIIEVGCGRNAYWASWMKRAGQVDVLAFDSNLQAGGVITDSNNKKQQQPKNGKDEVLLQKGGPEVLQRSEHKDRTLFLCYPDEDEDVAEDSDGDSAASLPFGWQCLENFQGTHVIHVGELGFLDPTNLSIDQAPWGRSSSLEFQQRLASEFHCVLKIQLPNWLHVRDTISVWKRSEICTIVFAAEDGDDDEDDENEEEDVVEYRHVPPDELLPEDVAAPCMAHLLPSSPPRNAAVSTKATEALSPSEEQQLLVQFQSKTHVVSMPATVKNPDSIDDSETSRAILRHLAKSTGWDSSRLRITHWNFPFVHVTAQSAIRGGKGGFGTLLKGQSRQAGAKLTTDFGACRDLQGRRLRHVNDEIKLRKFRERQRREQAGEKIDQDDLWKTPSGIYNWHLMTPTWADISKKATYRIKRQFRQMEREDQKKAALKKEQEEMHQKTMANYLSETTALSESVQKDLGDAIKQGLKNSTAAKTSKKRKLLDVEEVEEAVFTQEDRPSSLVSLTGEVVIEDSPTAGSSTAQLQSKSDFMTAVLVLDGSMATNSPTSCYYEVTLVTGGLAQIGWACLSNESGTFEPNNETGDGVGDDGNSFAIDGSRSLKFHGGEEWSYPVEWKARDCLGCLLEYDDTDGTKLSFSLNGKDLGVAFTTKVRQLVPAFSCNQSQILELHTSRDDCKFFPVDKSGVVAVKELLQDAGGNEDPGQKIAAAIDEPEYKPKQESPAQNPVPTRPVMLPPKESVKPELLDLEKFMSPKELEILGLDRLKSALMAIQVKCGGTLEQRAERLFSLKGLDKKDYPQKVRAKGFVA